MKSLLLIVLITFPNMLLGQIYSKNMDPKKYTVLSEFEYITIKQDDAPKIIKGTDERGFSTETIITNNSSKRALNREMVFQKTDNRVRFNFTIKRIQEKKGDFFDIDTDSPFSNDEKNKNITDHYLKYINSPLNAEYDANNGLYKKEETKLPIAGQWNSYLPMLNPIIELSLIYVDPINFSKVSWKDTLMDKENIYYNSYKVISKANDTEYEIEITGNGRAINEKVTSTSFKMPSNGEMSISDTYINNVEYNGKGTVNITSGFIYSFSLNMKKSSTISGIGPSFDSFTNSEFKIQNKIKSK